jgi:hypothetical protein
MMWRGCHLLRMTSKFFIYLCKRCQIVILVKEGGDVATIIIQVTANVIAVINVAVVNLVTTVEIVAIVKDVSQSQNLVCS